MTRNNPPGPPPVGYGSSASYAYQQPSYAGSEPSYGNYNTGEGQAGNGPPSPNFRQAGYSGQAQSYYGQNDQAYQQYPPQQYPPHPYGSYSAQPYQAPPGPPPSHHKSPLQQSPPQPAYPLQEYPPYGQQYPPQSAYGPPTAGEDVAAFRTHYEQPHGPLDPAIGQPAPEGDRGVMGALAGGAAGAFAGHRVHHGFLGGVGGAVAGSMLEDAYKKHSKEGKKQKRRGSGSSHSSSSSSSDDEKKHHGRMMAGNFCGSSRHVRLDGNMLVAECEDVNGRHHTSAIDLNDCLTNTNGRLGWARGGNFMASSRHVTLIDGGDVIEAELGDGRGGWRHCKLNLNERITNDNGRLAMV